MSYTIDGNAFSNFDEFVREFNQVFCAQFNATWNGNLNAFNDFLDWPILDTDKGYILVWKHSDLSRQRLGHSEYVIWLKKCLQRCHPSSVPHFTADLQAAERQEGPTLFDVLVEIIREHPEIELKLEK